MTDNVKYGIDYLLSQILAFYRRFYSQPSTRSLDPPAFSTPPPPPSASSLFSSPPPSLASSPSYSSFYSYTRTLSQGDLTSIVDSFDSSPSRPSFSPSLSPNLHLASPPLPHSPSRWSWLLSLFSRSSFRPFSSSSSSSSLHTRSQSDSSIQSHLPPLLRGLPLYLYSLHRGCLFGDCFHNGDLLQLHRLRLASASLQDSLRIILPRLVLARNDSDAPIHRIRSVPATTPPPPIPSVLSHPDGLASVGSMPLLPVQSSPSARSEVSVEKEEGCEFVMLVAEDSTDGFPYFMKKSMMGRSPSTPIHPELMVLPPETLALMSDAIVVLDTEREIFIWIGSERSELDADPLYDHCVSLALSMNQERFPPSIIRVVREGSSSARFVLSNLIPSHKDPIETSFLSLPFLATLPPPYLRQHCNKFLRTDDMSFREYMVKIYHFKCGVCFYERNGSMDSLSDYWCYISCYYAFGKKGVLQ